MSATRVHLPAWLEQYEWLRYNCAASPATVCRHKIIITRINLGVNRVLLNPALPEGKECCQLVVVSTIYLQVPGECDIIGPEGIPECGDDGQAVSAGW